MTESTEDKVYDCVSFNPNKSWARWQPYQLDKNFDNALNHKWATYILYLHCPNIISLFPKTTFRILKTLTLGEQSVSMDEFQSITSGGQIERFTAYSVKIQHKNGSNASLEDIFQCLPKAIEIRIQDNVPTINSIDVLKAINMSFLKEVNISQIHEGYDLQPFANYMKDNQNIRFHLHFLQNLTKEYQQNIQNISRDIVESWIKTSELPSFSIPVLTKSRCHQRRTKIVRNHRVSRFKKRETLCESDDEEYDDFFEPTTELPVADVSSDELNVPRIVLNADDFVVKSAPSTIRYIPNFIDTEMEEYLLFQVENAPKPKWEFFKNRRLQNWGGIVGKKSLISDNSMPQWLNMMIDKIMDLENGFPESNRPNHVLVNEYLPGQGIMPHTDGPAFFPMVSTISLGSHTFLDLYEPIGVNEEAKTKSDRHIGSMLLQPRSLILIKDDAYKVCLHGIEERDIDIIHEKIFNRPTNLSVGTQLKRSTRVSLTIRNVPSVNTSLMNRNLINLVNAYYTSQI